ncbi:MAG: hypothetical protein P8185_17245 [Deltaproteobacteria bacterium]|jgi:hypothetical protein
MLHAIGEAAMQQSLRANYDSEMYGQSIAVKKSDQVKGKRPVEKTEDSSRSEMGLKKEEDTRRKNTFEDGTIVVEEYNENGEIVRKTPPGYVLSNEMA